MWYFCPFTRFLSTFSIVLCLVHLTLDLTRGSNVQMTSLHTRNFHRGEIMTSTWRFLGWTTHSNTSALLKICHMVPTDCLLSSLMMCITSSWWNYVIDIGHWLDLARSHLAHPPLGCGHCLLQKTPANHQITATNVIVHNLLTAGDLFHTRKCNKVPN